jgi:outer membrane lipoprotein SlyB
MPHHTLFAARGSNDLQEAAIAQRVLRPIMHVTVRTVLILAIPALGLAACSPDLSPNTYNSAAVQQANKVDQGVVVGVRQVDVKVSGNTGAVAGAAAGGVIGGSLPGSATGQSLGTVGGGLLGGLLGSSVEQVAGDTKAFEYIVRKKSGELISVTQTGITPLVIGQNVLVIAGSQARIVPDYTVHLPDEVVVEKPKPKVEEAPPPPVAPVVVAPVVPVIVLPSSTNPAVIEAEKLFPQPAAASTLVDPLLPVPVIVPTPKPKEN